MSQCGGRVADTVRVGAVASVSVATRLFAGTIAVRVAVAISITLPVLLAVAVVVGHGDRVTGYGTDD